MNEAIRLETVLRKVAEDEPVDRMERLYVQMILDQVDVAGVYKTILLAKDKT